MLRIFRPKNPTATAGSEPAILGTRGQHANHETTEAALPGEAGTESLWNDKQIHKN
jgi:hypothetical protein